MNKLSGKIALITGGSRGLGRDTALNLAANGADIIITYHSNDAAAQEVLSEISKSGQKGIALQFDQANIAGIEDFAARVQQGLENTWPGQKLDILVNNAGTGAHALASQTSEEVFDQMINTHFKGVFFLTQNLLPLLSDGGRIINLSTGLTRFTIPGYAAYASAKGAIEVYTRYLAKELGGRGITVNAIAPGAIDNDFNKHAFDANPQMRQMLAGMTALGRVGLSSDIGGVVAFLAGPDSGWVTGQRIEVSGGMNM